MLHVGRLEHRPFTDHDVELLAGRRRSRGGRDPDAGARDRTGRAPAARTQPAARQAAESSRAEFAARYVPAEERSVGGDWYDVFTLPSGQLWIVVGDVAGHGSQAAVVMGRIRSALRAYALLDTSPAQRVLISSTARSSTSRSARWPPSSAPSPLPPYDTVHVASAGPSAAGGGDPRKGVGVGGGVARAPVGADAARRARSTTVALGAGAVMLLYTDGLVERRGEPSTVGSIASGRRSLPRPAEVTANLMHQLVGKISTRDDIAVVVLRRT